MNYSNFNIHLNKDVKIIEYDNNNIINVLQYLPIEEKNNIIQLALQNSEENGIYNILMIDMYFKLYIVYSYTDIEFTEDEKDNPIQLYDELYSGGLIQAIISAIPVHEYEYLWDNLKQMMDLKLQYRNTIASVINNFVENLPINANAAKDIIEKFNPDDFQEVLKFAQAANGNRPIN